MDGKSVASGDSPDTTKADDAERRQNTRACDFCHRMKMRCIGKEDPPCNRCRQSGQQCTFDGPRKSKTAKVEDRLKVVEEQMADVQATLAELITLQRSSMSSAAAPPSPVSRIAPSPTEPRGRSLLVPDAGGRGVASSSHSHSHHRHDWASTYFPPYDYSLASPSNPSPRNNHQQPSTSPIFLPVPPVRASPMPRDTSTRHSSPARRRSIPDESAGQSEDEDDGHPMVYNNMLRLAEAARLKADGQDDIETSEDPQRPSKRERGTEDSPPARKDDKRPRRASAADELLHTAIPRQRGNLVHQYQNPIELGFCSRDKGQQLYDLFMAGAAVYVPIFDPEVDTFDNLCATAPFTVSVILYVGSKIEDAGRETSELQKKCKDHAENIGMHTLFTPVARIDVLQAMIILSSWGDTSWRPGGHALRIAMDMGLYRCMPYLAASGMGAGKTAAELQDERQMVVGARCWLAVYKSEFEMAFNLGRPALFAVEDTLTHCRRFLQHPLSLVTDSRLVATCELLCHRLPIHRLYSIWPSATRVPDLDAQIVDANEQYSEWLHYWESYYRQTGVSRTTILHESLYSQHAHAVLHTNSRLLHTVRSRRHISQLSPSTKALLVQALRSAETLVTMALRGASYASHFGKANYYTHIGVAFAARTIIRLMSLIPDAVTDLKQTGRDLEAIAQRLAQVPGFQFAHHIRDILAKARRKHVLPPSSKAASPTLGSVPLPGAGERESARERNTDVADARRYPHSASPTGRTPRTPSTSLFSPSGGKPTPLPHDFLYAEQLFADAPALELEALEPPAFAFEPIFTLDSWFPYPPLESDASSLGLAGSPFGGGGAVGGVGGLWQ